MSTPSLFRALVNAIVQVEEICLARYTPRQGGEGAISAVLPDGDCDPGRAASCLSKIIGASLYCPCILCRGVAWQQVFS